MLDPIDCFFQNSKGFFIEYNRSILEVDPLESLAEVGLDKEKFLKRRGTYDWLKGCKILINQNPRIHSKTELRELYSYFWRFWFQVVNECWTYYKEV